MRVELRQQRAVLRLPGRSGWLSLPVFLLAISHASVALEITWPRDLFNPKPRPDDVLVPLPCGGAMAFRWVQAEGAVPAGASAALAPLYRLRGPFAHDGGHYLLIGKYEVAELQYRALAAAGTGTCPEIAPLGRMVQGRVGWIDAMGAAVRGSRWLAETAGGLPDCASGAVLCAPRQGETLAVLRLANEAEWEYAARGGLAVAPAQFAESLYPMDGGLEAHVWYQRNTEGKLKPIGYREPNPLGLHDIYGNVEELTLDTYRSPQFPGQVGAAAIRGGSVHTKREDLSASRRSEVPLYGTGGANRAPDNGFRLVLDLPAGETVASLPPLPPPTRIDQPVALGHLQVNVDVPAQVRLDGQPAGQVVPGKPLELTGLALGEHRVELEAEGYATAREQPRIGANRWTQVAVAMQSAVRTVPSFQGRLAVGLLLASWFGALLVLGLVVLGPRTKRRSDGRAVVLTQQQPKSPVPSTPGPDRLAQPRQTPTPQERPDAATELLRIEEQQRHRTREKYDSLRRVLHKGYIELNQLNAFNAAMASFKEAEALCREIGDQSRLKEALTAQSMVVSSKQIDQELRNECKASAMGARCEAEDLLRNWPHLFEGFKPHLFEGFKPKIMQAVTLSAPTPATETVPAVQAEPEREPVHPEGNDEAARQPIAASATASETPRLLAPTHSFKPEMIALPGGEYWMGSPEDEPDRFEHEGPRHRVRVQAFAIGKTAVTFAQYDTFAEATSRAKPSDEGWGRENRPVINVSWDDAVAYAQWLSEQTGGSYRLPSEAEWEYAARAGTETPFWTGRCIHTDQANYNGNYDYDGCGAKTGVYRAKTVPVGSLPANPWGLYEVHGNVWEWVQDRWHGNYDGAPVDGSAWDRGDGSARVARGGSWRGEPRNLRSADRRRVRPGNRDGNLGFRLARTLPP